jgi:thiol:disulfide interchange protein
MTVQPFQIPMWGGLPTCGRLPIGLFGLCALLLAASSAIAQQPSHADWTLSSDIAKAPPGSTVTLRLTAKIEAGYHIYSMTTPDGGGKPTSIKLAEDPAVESYSVYQAKPKRKFDDSFKVDVETFDDPAVFLISTQLNKDVSANSVDLVANFAYQVCSDKECFNKPRNTATYTLAVDRSATPPAAFVIPAGYTEVKPGVPSESPAPVAPAETSGLGAFLLTAFGVGLLSIFTPCVFPMIPITVSFFLNQRGGLVQALVFSLGIIGLFCALGLGVTEAVGPFGVVQLGSNRWVNGFIALVFGAFALSLLGAFEITLPSSLLTNLDRASRRGGYLGTLLMGLTFSLTSFACVGPFVGPLLVSTVQDAGTARPVLGMLSFATGLASPFFFLAAFPAYLKKLPRSGGWLARVKVVMGFVLLALMLKYLSNVDQVLQLHLLTRERFLAAWFVLFAMPGLYLLGMLRLEGVEAGESLGIGRLITASAFLIFAFTLIPGMFCGSLGELDAYVPAATSCAAAGGSSAVAARPVWMKNQYREALDLARQQNKLVLVTFTGYTCTNCKWMEYNMFPKPEITAAAQDLVLVELYTDGADAARQQNEDLEDTKFHTSSQPYYAILDADEKVVATFGGLTRDTEEFLKFLKTRPGA